MGRSFHIVRTNPHKLNSVEELPVALSTNDSMRLCGLAHTIYKVCLSAGQTAGDLAGMARSGDRATTLGLGAAGYACIMQGFFWI